MYDRPEAHLLLGAISLNKFIQRIAKLITKPRAVDKLHSHMWLISSWHGWQLSTWDASLHQTLSLSICYTDSAVRATSFCAEPVMVWLRRPQVGISLS
jgi:hypothetical protein